MSCTTVIVGPSVSNRTPRFQFRDGSALGAWCVVGGAHPRTCTLFNWRPSLSLSVHHFYNFFRLALRVFVATLCLSAGVYVFLPASIRQRLLCLCIYMTSHLVLRVRSADRMHLSFFNIYVFHQDAIWRTSVDDSATSAHFTSSIPSRLRLVRAWEAGCSARV